MSREVVVAVLERTAVDLAFRQLYERYPGYALVGYAPDLTDDEWLLLVYYPEMWLDEQSVADCPRCDGLAVIATNGDLVFCPKCRPLPTGQQPVQQAGANVLFLLD